jgi:gliding motility-associated-like protein
MKLKLLFVVIVVTLLKTVPVLGSHVPGGNITYTCTGNNQYFVKLTLFEDCSTGFGLGNSAQISARCNGTNLTFTLNLSSGPTEVSQLCSSQMSSSSCNGGTLPGIERSIFTGTITLPFACDSWTLGYGLCCRNTSVNVSGQPSLYIETKLNNLADACNSSPYVTAQPIPYVCLNQPVNYNLGVVDAEADSLSFALVSALDGPGINVTYNAGYSATQPIPGASINSQTGQLTFTPNATGSFIFAIKILEYDSAGNILSSIIHDFRFEVISCINQTPTGPSNGISSFTGTAKKTGPTTIEGCPGDNFCFNVSFNDLNLLDTINVTSNVTSALPGSTLSLSSSTNPRTATICWTIPQNASSVYPFTLTARDNACPVYGQATMAITVKVIEGVTAGPDDTICSGQSSQLMATGGTAYTWSVISGPPMVVGTNISCSNCANPIVTPTATTIYKVTSNLSTNCINSDTVKVVVVPDYAISITPATSTVCMNQAVQLNVNTNASSGPYSYQWTPAAGLTNSTISNPIATPLVTTTYTAFVTNLAGCTKKTTTVINVSGIGPTVEITEDTTICLGQSVQLNSTITLQPGFCGINTSACTGAAVTGTIGTGTFDTDYGGPFYSHLGTGHSHPLRNQYIYTAAELYAAGFTAGVTINEIALDLSTANAGTFESFSVKMGCTSMSNYPDGNFLPGLSTVYSAPVFNIPASAGWLVIQLQSKYDWDGVSNLVVEFCSAGSPLPNSGRIRYTSSSPYYLAIYDHEETGGCNKVTGIRNYMRANMKFNACRRQIGQATYSWTPTAGLSNPSIPNPIATPTTSTTYVLNVTDGATGCIGSASIYIGVGPDYILTVTPNQSICYGSNTQLNASPGSQGTYTYGWSPPLGLSSTSIANPVANPGVTTQYHVTASNGNCIKRDSVTVNVYGVPITATASLDTVCPGSTVQLDITSFPSSCGLNPAGCSGNTNTSLIGNGTFSSSSYSPFYGAYEDSRVQYLYKANDLLSSGVTPGTITSIAFKVLSKGSNAPFSGFTIKMGCTNSTNLTSAAWEATAGVVYGPVNYSSVLGWNTFTLTTPYNWDGVSNLVIEVCFDNNITAGADLIEYTSPVNYYATLRNYQNGGSGCSLAPGFRYMVYPNLRIGVCNSSLPANAIYQWTPATGLSNPNIPNPVATVNYTITYTVNVSEPSLPGCTSVASVVVATDLTNTVTASSDVTICPGGTTQLSSTFAGPPPVSSIPCGANNTNCSGPINTITVGSGSASNGTTSYPAVYGNYYWGAKHQILYTAAELAAMNMNSGTISQIGFNVAAINGTAVYENVSIRMGCTNQSSLTTWVNGLTTVFTAASYTVTTGWNMHTLTNSFDWDGVSNLVVEFCFNNSSYQQNISTYYTPTSFNSVIYYRADNSSVCSSAGYVSASTFRPNTIFKICNAPPAVLTYLWTPSAGLSNTTIPNPQATPTATTTYIVNVFGTHCDLKDTVVVTVSNPNASFIYGGPFCKNGTTNPVPQFPAGATAGTFSASPTGLSFVSNATGEVNLAASSPGLYTITNTITGAPGCAGAVATDTLRIRAVPSMTTTNIVACSGAVVPATTFTSTPAGATFSWTNSNTSVGLGASGASSIPSFTASNNTSSTILATVNVTPSQNGCTGIASSFTISVKPAPAINPLTNVSYCTGVTTAPVTPISTPAGASFTWSNSNTAIGLSGTGTGNIPTFTATNTGSSAITGTVTIQATLAGCTGPTGSYSITVNPPDNSSFSYSTSTFCQTGTNPVPTITGVTGGQFTGTAGLSINASTGEINLGATSVGQYTVTYQTATACSSSSTQNISVTNSSNASFNYSGPYCNVGTATPTLASGASIGVFSSTPSGLIFSNSSTGEINLSSSAAGTYQITNTITPSGGCAGATAVDTVVIGTAQTATFSFNGPYCKNATDPSPIFNTGSVAGTFSSSSTNLSINSSTGLVSLSASLPGTYTVTNSIPASGGCPAVTATAPIEIRPVPTTTVTSNSYCAGTVVPTMVFTSTPAGATFSWSNDNTSSGLNSFGTGNVPSFTATNNGSNAIVSTITVVPELNGCTGNQASYTITVDPADDASFIYTGNNFCQTGSNPIPQTVNSNGTFNGSTGLVINSSTGEIDLGASNTGTHQIIHTTNGVCPAADTTTITISNTTNAIFSFNNSYCKSSTGNPVPVFPSGSAAGTFTSSPSGLVFTNSTTGEINLSLTSAGIYVITNNIAASGGCAAASYSDTVRFDDPVIASAGSDLTLCSGETGNLGATSSATATYSWSPATGLSNSSIATPTITIQNTSAGNMVSTYTVTAINGSCSSGDLVQVEIAAPITVNAGVIQQTTCANACNAQVGAIANGGHSATYSYSWSNGSTTAFNTNICAGSYSVVVKDDIGCEVISNTVTVTDPPSMVSSVSSTPGYCGQALGSASVQVSGGTGTYSYSWDPSALTTDSITNVVAGVYIVHYTDQNQCTGNDTIVIPDIAGPTANISSTTDASCYGKSDGKIVANVSGGTSPYTLTWDNGQSGLTITNLGAATYCLTVTDNKGCTTVICDSIKQPTETFVAVSNDTTICRGSNATLTGIANGGTGPGYTYSWSPSSGLNNTNGSSVIASPGSVTTYTVTGTDSRGCKSLPATVIVNLNSPLVASTSSDTSVCPGQSMQLSVTAAGGNNGPYTYSWYPAVGLNATNTPVVTASTTNSGTIKYFVKITDNCTAQPARDTVTITVYNVETPEFNSNKLQGCSPLGVTFINDEPNSLSCTWDIGDGSTGSGDTISYIYTAPGYYSVKMNIIDQNGCESNVSKADYIYVSEDPIADFTTQSDSVSIYEPYIQFTDLSMNAYYWNWSFGDMDSSITQNPLHVFPSQDSGTYIVQLKVYNEYGCEDSISKIVKIMPEGAFYIPNAFSPNGDGINDVFIPIGNHISGENYSMQIFDRWGNIIFSTTDPKQGWNGTINDGSSTMESVYVYKIRAFNAITNKRYNVNAGSVTIVH